MKSRIPQQALAILAVACVAAASHAGTAPPASHAGSAPPASAPATPLNLADHSLLYDSLSLNQLEIDVSAYAATHANSDKVRKFAQRMTTEHSQLEVEIQKANDGLIVSPPKTAQPDLSLAGQNGDAFDRVYVAIMAADDDTLLMKMRTVPDLSMHNPTIRDMAKRILPTLIRLDAEAKDLQRSLQPE